MSEYVTAKSYQHMEWAGEPFKENGKMYVIVKEACPRCSGKGVIPYWAFNDNGTCFACKGAGIFQKKVRLYTKEEMAKQEAAAKRKKAEKQAELKANSEIHYQEWLEKNGFNTEGVTFCVFGDDTYAIKEWLKEQGCRFDPVLKWHCATEIAIPEGYGVFALHFKDLYTWNMYLKNATPLDEINEVVDRAYKEAAGPSLSEYVGQVGDRLRDITAIYKSVRGFSGQYGWTNIYTFESQNNVLVWFTQKELNLEKGAVINLTATVKGHEEFRGVKTTQLSRAIIKEVK